MSALHRKRSCAAQTPMSAMGQADSCAAAKKSLLDHLVGVGKQRLGHCESKCLSGLEIDYQLKFAWLLCCQIRRMCSLQDSIHVTSRLAALRTDIRAIRDQTTALSKISIGIHCWNAVI